MKKQIVLCLAGIALIPVASVLAHHPVQAKFDAAQQVSLSGRVTEIDWANPHTHIFINVETATGELQNWAVELQSPIDLEWGGWRPDTLAVGTLIEVQGPRARDGSEQVWGDSIVVAGGSPVFQVPDNILESQLGERTNRPTPRWPDGHPRLGPEPGESGYWSVPSLHALVETGVSIEMDRHGILADIGDAGRVAPFQDWARDLYLLRQQNFLKDDPQFIACIPPGGPRMFQVPYGVAFLEQLNHKRVTVLMGGGNSNWRLIHLDGREQVGQVTGNDNNPLFFGRSLGRWEGDSFVVESTGFNETFWFSNGGLPHTRLLKLTERFTRIDLDTLEYHVMVDDPGAYTREWESSWTLRWVEGKDLPDHYCQDNRP